MKKSAKLLCLLLAVVMTAGMLCGCGGKKTEQGDRKFTYWTAITTSAQVSIKNYNELLFYQELEKLTGVEIEFLHPTAGSTASESFNVLLASTDMPDMVEYNWAAYPGGPDAAISDKVIIKLNDYLEKFAPDYYDYMEGEKGKAKDYIYKAQTITRRGNYYGFNSLSIGTYRGFAGFYVRKDLLDKWGLDIPETIDDWDNVFATAKANGIKYPLTGDRWLFQVSEGSIFESAWGVGKEFHVEGDKVVFSVEQPEYRDYLIKMAEWFKKGYINPDYITDGSDEVLGDMTTGKSIASHGYVGSAMGALIPAMAERDSSFKLAACPYPVLKKGDVGKFQELSAESRSPMIAVTVACGKDDEKRYEDAVKWCNTLYTEEGKILKSFGVEGVTYTKEKRAEPDQDGDMYTYTYTSIITDDNDPGRKEINASSVSDALYHFMLPANAPGLNQHNDYLNGFYQYEEQKDAIKVWNQNVEEARKHVLPPLSYTDAQAERVNEIKAKAFDGLNAAVQNTVLCKMTIEEFDEALAKAKKDGYDELTKIYQEALDNYNAGISK